MERTSAQQMQRMQMNNSIRHKLRAALPLLSLFVVIGIFWWLKLTGVTLAGEAFCGMQEHVHGEECNLQLVCTETEDRVHTHGETCWEQILSCTLPETEGHTHTEACTGRGLICQEEHTHDETACYGDTLICGKEAAEAHAHGENCFTRNLVCEQAETVPHVHGEACYEGECGLKAHIHGESCYSDIHADLETTADWEQMFAGLPELTGTKENVVAVAQSQIGYQESEANFQVDANGVRRGITRYGQWYGNPYGDWSAMFVSFCLYQAGVKDAPANGGPESMRLEWERAGLYQPDSKYGLEVGNLVFLHKDGETNAAGAAAIITAVDETAITVVEGDVENTVVETKYAPDDPAILGYGIVPASDSVIIKGAALAAAGDVTIWLDGTDGGMGHLSGSPNVSYTVQNGSTMQLPGTWTSPSKYSYKLRGWYDVSNSRYYPAGAEMVVTGNAVLYADWVASTYDLGVFNAQVVDTVSTNAFITTHLFDYNYLFNIQSANASVTVNNREHSENWSMVTSGTVNYKDQTTFDFVFTDNDGEGTLDIPKNRSNRNRYHDATTVTTNIYSSTLGERLFSPYNGFDPQSGTGILGKTYLGTGDHLFQIMDKTDSEFYGYYYYDSKRNAASYNQSNRRFYVYDYLSATSDSIGGAYSDFLPLNSPYANTNGQTVGTYNYNGVDGEYQGATHYRYDSKYNSGNHNSANNVYTDYAYGMRSDINFYLPGEPGSGGNTDLYGNPIEFWFSGDDDLWVLVDGVVVLDIGGIHQAIAGNINFSTGQVVVNGSTKTSLMDLGIGAGDHVMTVLYLERGASMSNCSIYFNLAPRFGLEIQKEDVLTQALLNGTEFTVYEDFGCTEPAELWESEAAYSTDREDGVLDQSTSTFTVTDGVARIWGLGAGNTYYIKETGPPLAEGYALSNGLIRLTLEKGGLATYQVEVIADADGHEPSNGFTVHGENIDEETKTVFIVATNAPESVVETTTVQVYKRWEDTEDHSKDYIQAYLTVTDPDGTIRRIREITLSDENEWSYTWTNLPKYNYDALTEVHYGVEESYESGYYSTVRRVTKIEISRTEWAEATSFINGESYILRSSSGYLSTTSSSDAKLKWVDEATAQSSALATWTVTVSGGKLNFINGAKQKLSFQYNSNSSRRYFYATTANSSTNVIQSFTAVDAGTGFRLYAVRSNSSTKYYMATSGINSEGRIPSTTSSSGLILTPMEQITETDIKDVQDWAYQITNTPLASGNETSVAVQKQWVIPDSYNETLYHEFAVTVRLMANGVNTGRTLTLTLKNNWQGTFLGLPYKDGDGNVIQYTVVESWDVPRWNTKYEPMQTSGGDPVNYSVTITNTYHPGGPELPSTGSAARLMYVLCGSGMMLGALVYGIGSRRKRERRMK